MSDRERMIEVIDEWQTEATGCKQAPEYAEELCRRLIEAGFGAVKKPDKKTCVCEMCGAESTTTWCRLGCDK